MTWSSMVKKLAKKGRSRLAALFRMKHALDPDNMEIMYKALVRSVMEYENVAYRAAGATYLKKLDSVQECACELGGFSVEALGDRRDASLIGLAFKLLDGHGHGDLQLYEPDPARIDLLNGDWMPNIPAPPPKREPRSAATVCKQKNREIFDKKKLLDVQLPVNARTGYQLKVTTTNSSWKEYIKSEAGSLPAVWDR